MTTEAARKAAEALAEAFTPSHGARNRNWDIEGPDDDTNPYYLPRSMEDRVRDGAWITFTDTDGHTSMAAAPITEIVKVLAEAGMLKEPSTPVKPAVEEVFEIYDKLSRTRLNEVIYDNAGEALDLLARANVDPRQYVVRSIRFERKAKQ